MLTTYTGERMDVRGDIEMDVQYGEQKESLVIAGTGPALLGRNWLQHLRLNWKELGAATLHHSSTDTLETILDRYSSVFADGLSCIKHFKAKFHVKPNAPPKFHRARPVPFAIKDIIRDEFDCHEKEGILEKVMHSDWASPIVAVPKQDGKFRICGDYKATVNPSMKIDQYLLPKPEDLFPY